MIETKISLPDGISSQTMFRCSMKDKDGNLWFGTTGAGVYKYDGKLFTHYSEKEGLSSNFVVSIAQDIKGSIWVATNDGLCYSDGNNFERLVIHNFESPKSNIITNNLPAKKIQVFCVIGDKNGNIWFGTESEGLWKYDGHQLTNFKYADSKWKEVNNMSSINYQHQGFVSAIVEDKKGNIWFSSSTNGLNYYDGKSFVVVGKNSSAIHTLQLIEDTIGNIWMATRLNGICRYNGKTLESFLEKDGVSDNMASSLYEAKNGKIWFGSLGKAGTSGGGLKGITVYDGNNFTPIASTGMRNNQVWTIIEDNIGNIWVGTKEFGLYRYDGTTFTEFTTQ
ncbi:ligand-binding sensor domain-containing protein [Emticicia sp. SJ17W-69]|uniref:ligand-binding sensor domain-containing protein n=1 Tax=Emticicia sp. SJ17W-69 TaxID=3421657 RepID=UPI003EB76786